MELSQISNEVDSALPGDINGDNSVNIQDIVFLINFILGVEEPNNEQYSAADLNNDGDLNIQDIILIINIILGWFIIEY